jgi:hypothetical protein
MAKSCAFFVRDKIKSAYEGHLSKLKTEVELIKDVYKNAKQDYQKNDDYDKRITEEFRRNPRHFSKALAFIYLSFAILLVFADIPLALKLTQAGFDLDLGENFFIQDLFKHPLKVFQENWEVFILSFGIALCTIYIKIFYDEFLASPIERNIVKFKHLEGIETTKEKKTIKKIHFGRLAFKITVLLFALGTIFMLGQFRFETIEYQNRLKELALSGETAGNTDELFPASDPANIANTNQEVAGESWRKLVTKYTFIAITILFPVIGGICASLGLNNLHNIKELKNAKKLSVESTKEYREESNKLNEANRSITNWESALNWCESEGFIKHLLSLFLNHYDHGYQRGLLSPETLLKGTDLFEKAEQLRNKHVSREIFEIMHTVKPLEGSIDFNKKVQEDFASNSGLKSHKGDRKMKS